MNKVEKYIDSTLKWKFKIKIPLKFWKNEKKTKRKHLHRTAL